MAYRNLNKTALSPDAVEKDSTITHIYVPHKITVEIIGSETTAMNS